MTVLRVALAQLDLTVGDLVGNADRIARAYDDAVAGGADLVLFPELAVTGYPPEDLLLRHSFVQAAAETVEKLAARTGRAVSVVGYPEPPGEAGRRPRNAAAVCADGQVLGVYRKCLLPNYSVFDEERYFEAGTDPGPLYDVAGVRVGVSICEDVWFDHGPPAAQAALGAQLVVNINASPYYRGRVAERESMLAERTRQIGVPIAYVNLVGGQDELVFDGASLVVTRDGRVAGRARQFAPDLLLAAIDVDAGGAVCDVAPLLDDVAEIYEALVTGTRDYVGKNGFRDVVVGLSGGIDSALVATIAADALGPEHVLGVLMPSRYSSEGSVRDAARLAANLGVRTSTIPIEPAHAAFLEMFAEAFAGTDPGIAEENIQARVRGTILLTLSNRFGSLVLTTGNKSEMAVGYATLAGDLAGGFAVIKDVPKTLVYRLARYRNARAGTDLIPQAVLDKPPSAELRPGQLDTDSLPPYEVLDPILEGYVEGDRSIRELEASGFDPETVRRVVALVDRNEYKRRQAPPGVRISPRAFGKDWRLPITNRWRG